MKLQFPATLDQVAKVIPTPVNWHDGSPFDFSQTGRLVSYFGAVWEDNKCYSFTFKFSRSTQDDLNTALWWWTRWICTKGDRILKENLKTENKHIHLDSYNDTNIDSSICVSPLGRLSQGLLYLQSHPNATGKNKAKPCNMQQKDLWEGKFMM